MKYPTPTFRSQRCLRRSPSFAASVAALTAAVLSISSGEVRAASGVWQANPADQGVMLNIESFGEGWTISNPLREGEFTPTPHPLREGDAIFVGATGGLNLGTSLTYYYAVGVGATPSGMVRFSQSPGSVTFAPNGVGSPLPVTKVSSWFNQENWVGGVVPNGAGHVASVATSTGLSAIMIDRDLTLGGLNVDTTVSSATGLSLFATTRTAGPIGRLVFASGEGTPTVTLSGGNSLSLSEAKISGNIPGNASAKLSILGEQGLIIDNQNPVGTPVAVNSSTAVPPVPIYATGAVRFGFGLDWSKFNGDLTLVRGVFQPLAGGSLNNNLSSMPMANKVVLGTGTNTARIEIIGNGSTGPTSVRGLESTSPNSSIINASGSGVLTFQVGSFGRPEDDYVFAGNIGDNADVATLASAPALRLVKVGPGSQTLSGENNLNAIATNSILVAVNGGKLSLGTTGAIGTVTNGQGATNADSSILLKNGEFVISGVGIDRPRSQTFADWLIFGTIAPNTNTRDANQSAQGASFSTLTVIADPAQPASLNFGRVKDRNFASGSPNSNLNGTTMLYRGTNLGAAPGPGVGSITFATPPTAGIFGYLKTVSGSGALDSAQAPVLKGALADTSPTGKGAGFATYETGVGVRLLKPTEQTVVTTGAAYDAASVNDNIRINLAADQTITGHLSNTLQVDNVSGAVRTLTNTGAALNAVNGLLFSGSDAIVLSGGEITGTAISNGEDVLFHSINTSGDGVTLATPVTNIGDATFPYQGWITYNGPGNFRVVGAQTVGALGGIVFNSTGTTTFAAPLTGATNLSVNQGLVKLDAGATWTNAPRLILAPEGKFDLNGQGSTATERRFTDLSASINAAGLSINPTAGEVTNSAPTAVDLVLFGNQNGGLTQPFFGTITGNINLVVDRSTFNAVTGVFTYGTQSLGAVNTYTGQTRIRSGILNIARGGQLPATTVVTLGTPDSAANATLSLGDGNGSTNGHIRQTVAGLYATGTGTAAVLNQGANIGQLTINTAELVDNVYTGNLGQTPAANGSSQNLFALRKTGAGSFEIAGAINQYSGGTVIEGGFLRVSSDDKLGQIGSLTGEAGSYGAPHAPMSAFANNIVLNGGSLQVSTTPNFVLNPLRGIGLGPVSGSVGGTGGLWVNADVTLTYAGVIASAGNTGTQVLRKQGPGRLLLNGASTFTGVTQVQGGALGGTGSLASAVTVESGGAVAPGADGLGTFTIAGALAFNAGSALNVDIAAPGSSDALVVGGTVSASGTATINLNGLDGFGAGTYTLITAGSPISTANFRVGTTPAGFRGTLAAVGNSLTLTLAPGSALSALETWREQYFGNSANSGNGADSFDADGDGLVNLLEYATGTNPTVAGPASVSAGRAGAFLTLTYTRVADETLVYTVEGSNDLVTWTAVSAPNNPSSGAQNVAGPVTITDTVSVTGASVRRFLRLKVAQP